MLKGPTLKYTPIDDGGGSGGEKELSLDASWSVFASDSSSDQQYTFEIHNPRDKTQSLILRANSDRVRSEWMSKVREALQSAPQPGAMSSERAGAAMAKDDIVKALSGMGFSKGQAERAAEGAKGMDEALERVMTLQTVEGS